MSTHSGSGHRFPATSAKNMMRTALNSQGQRAISLLPGERLLEKKDSHFNVVRYVDHGVDNYPPQINISYIVREWNKRFEDSIFLRFFHYI